MHMTSLKFTTMADALAASRQFRESRKMLTQTKALRSVTFREDVKTEAPAEAAVRTIHKETDMHELKELLVSLGRKIEQGFERRTRRDSTDSGDWKSGTARRSPSRSRTPSPSRTRCFRCQGWGHLARDCPSPGTSGNENRAENAA